MNYLIGYPIHSALYTTLTFDKCDLLKAFFHDVKTVKLCLDVVKKVNKFTVQCLHISLMISV